MVKLQIKTIAATELEHMLAQKKIILPSFRV